MQKVEDIITKEMFQNHEIKDGKTARVILFETVDKKLVVRCDDENLVAEIEDFLKNLKKKFKFSESFIFNSKIEENLILLIYFEEKYDKNHQAKLIGAKSFNELGKYEIKNFQTEKYLQDFVIEGMVIKSYAYKFNKIIKESEKKENENSRNYYFKGNEENILLAKIQNFVRMLTDTPANQLTPTIFSRVAVKFLTIMSILTCSKSDDEIDYESQNVNLKNLNVKIYDKKFLEENNMNLILSVSKGSKEEPKLLKIKYSGNDSEILNLSLVGKGVTFDSGGISIKPSNRMHEMKGDMGGAAAVLGTIGSLIALKSKLNVSVVIPLVENMPSSTATKPGDVFRSMSGKTVEVLNTDAEGRLILADALTFSQLDKPQNIIDVATLTGAVCVSLADFYNGVFTKSEKFAKKIISNSEKVSDFSWRLPLHDHFSVCLKSKVADLSNIDGNSSRLGGSSIAASFLNEFVEKNTEWCHLDIAGTSLGGDSLLYGGNTGRPLRLLVSVCREFESELSK